MLCFVRPRGFKHGRLARSPTPRGARVCAAACAVRACARWRPARTPQIGSAGPSRAGPAVRRRRVAAPAHSAPQGAPGRAAPVTPAHAAWSRCSCCCVSPMAPRRSHFSRSGVGRKRFSARSRRRTSPRRCYAGCSHRATRPRARVLALGMELACRPLGTNKRAGARHRGRRPRVARTEVGVGTRGGAGGVEC